MWKRCLILILVVGAGLAIHPRVAWVKVNYFYTFGDHWTIDSVELNELHFLMEVNTGDPITRING